MKTSMVFLLAFIALSGCVSLSPKAQNVMITTDINTVEKCKFLADVTAEAATDQDVTYLLKNTTSSAGGDTYYQVSLESTFFHRSAKGKAYDCKR